MRWLLIVVMAVLLAAGIGLTIWEPTGPYSEFCHLDAPLADPPPGWDWERDHNNDCEMTLFDDGGDRAPAELYAGTNVEPPPDYPYDWDGVGWALVVTSIVGVGATLRATNVGESPT